MKLLQGVARATMLAGMLAGGASLTGCASFVANNTAPAPLGVPSSERSFAQVITDNGIVRTAKINLYKLDDRFNRSRVNIDSFHSVVLLTGQVPDPHLKTLAEQNVSTMRDVQAVHNYLTVGEQIGYQQIVQDGWITTTIRASILRSKIRDTRVKVTTEAGVVYVMGRLTATGVPATPLAGLAVTGVSTKGRALTVTLKVKKPGAQKVQPLFAVTW